MLPEATEVSGPEAGGRARTCEHGEVRDGALVGIPQPSPHVEETLLDLLEKLPKLSE